MDIPENDLDLLHSLLQIPCPSGREERMATFVGQSIEALGFSAHSDAQGNVCVEAKSRYVLKQY